jgi:HEAT repeat protein
MRRAPFANKLARKPDIDRLVEDLSRTDLVAGDEGVVDLGAETRAQALVAIAELGDRNAVGAVARCLEDPVPAVRQTAVQTLAKLDPGASRDALIHGVVSWGDPAYADARLEAVRTLQQLDDPSVPERLVHAVASSNGSTVLDGITRHAIVDLVAASGEDGTGPDEVVLLLMDMLRQADGNRRNLEILLAWLGPYSVDELVEALDDPELRESAATVLGALKESRGVSGLVGCLEDDRAEVRLAAAWALGEIRDVRAVEGLIRAVSDVDYEVRRQAQEALDALGTVGVVAGVSAVLQLVMEKGPQQLPEPRG